MLKIGILISNDGDPFVQQFCLWVLHLGHTPIPIYEQDLYKNKLLNIDINSHSIGVEILCNDGNKIIFDEIDVFFRRSWHNGIPFSTNEEEYYKAQEVYALKHYVLKKIEESGKLIGKCSLDSLNKMIHLNCAQNIGFKIPQTKIVNKKIEVNFGNKREQYIAKAIDATYLKKNNQEILTNYTVKFTKNNLPTCFFPTLFQLKVEKKVELRLFIFFDLFFCGAFITSKKVNQSEIDVRILIAEGKTECYPFSLPFEIKEKIKIMMKELKIDMASIDLIIDNKGEFIFLDLNPFGQISMLSACFHNLERDVVKKVIDYAKRRNNRSEICEKNEYYSLSEDTMQKSQTSNR